MKRRLAAAASALTPGSAFTLLDLAGKLPGICGGSVDLAWRIAENAGTEKEGGAVDGQNVGAGNGHLVGGRPPLVTVVVATDNGGGTLRSALESLRGQDLDDFEVWVVGDGGSDDSGTDPAEVERTLLGDRAVEFARERYGGDEHRLRPLNRKSIRAARGLSPADEIGRSLPTGA